MSRWVDRLANHELKQSIEVFAQRVSEAAPHVEDNPTAVLEVERLKQISDQIRRSIDAADPVVISSTHLDALNSQVQQVNGELGSFLANKNVRHLVNANNYADAMIVNIIVLSPPRTLSQVEGIREAVTSLRSAATNYMHSLEKRTKDLQAKLSSTESRADEINADVNSQKARIDSAIAQMQEQSLTHESSRRSDFDASLKEWEKAHAALLRVQEGAFTSETKVHEERFASLLDEAQKQMESLGATLQQQASKVMDSLNVSKTEAEELIGAISMKSMAGGYQRIANREIYATRIWQALTVLSMIGLVVVAFNAIRMTGEATFDWVAFGARVFAAVSIGVLSAYAAKQAEKHHESERRNRRMELELTALDPYLAALPVEDRNKVKTELVARLFAQPETISTRRDLATNGNATDILKLVVELLSKK